MPDGSTRDYQGGLSPGVVAPGIVFARWRQLSFPPIHPAGAMWRRTALLAYGGWSALPVGEDTAVLVAATQHHPSVYVDRETFLYRRHDAQLSVSPLYQATRAACNTFIELRALAAAAEAPRW
jgi:hypothetical protein